MAAVSQISINDEVPAAHDFDPAGHTPDGLWFWEDRSGGIPLGYDKIALQLRNPGGASGAVRNHRAALRFEMPILKEVASGGQTSAGYTPGPELSHRLVASLNVVIPVLSTSAERLTFWSLFENLCFNSHVRNAMRDVEPPF